MHVVYYPLRDPGHVGAVSLDRPAAHRILAHLDLAAAKLGLCLAARPDPVVCLAYDARLVLVKILPRIDAVGVVLAADCRTGQALLAKVETKWPAAYRCEGKQDVYNR